MNKHFNNYTAKYPSKCPGKSTVTLIPIGIAYEVPGVYNFAFSHEGVNILSAKNINITNANSEFTINSATPFLCSSPDKDKKITVYLLDKYNEPIIGGSIPIFGKFGSLEPNADTDKVFEPQRLKYICK